jgi:segregation and condensation protein B
MSLPLSKKIIQILLFEGGESSFDYLAKYLKVSSGEIEAEIPEVKELLSVLDLSLVQSRNKLEIALSKDVNKLISQARIEELKTELSESALQTLSVVIYKERATKAEIDFIRGVDSSRSLKTLSMRGIIQSEMEKNRKCYSPTTETLRYLGVGSVSDVVDQPEINLKLKALIEGDSSNNN